MLVFEFDEGSPVKNGSVLVLLEDSEDDMFKFEALGRMRLVMVRGERKVPVKQIINE